MVFEVLPAPCFIQDSYIVDAGSEMEALEILNSQGYDLGIMAYRLRLKFLSIRYPGCDKPIQANVEKIMRDFMQNIINEAGYVTSVLEFSPVLHRAVGYFLEYPDIRGAIVRLSDEKQIIMSKANTVLLGCSSLTQAVERKRREYWHLEDLEEFRQATRGLEPNNPDSLMEFSFRIYDPVTGGNWRRNTNQFKLLEDGRGDRYHFSINLDQESIAVPNR